MSPNFGKEHDSPRTPSCSFALSYSSYFWTTGEQEQEHIQNSQGNRSVGQQPQLHAQFSSFYTTATIINTINIVYTSFFFLSTTLCTYYFFSFQHIQHLYLYSFHQEGTANSVRVTGRSVLMRSLRRQIGGSVLFCREPIVHDRLTIYTLDKPLFFSPPSLSINKCPFPPQIFTLLTDPQRSRVMAPGSGTILS